MTKQLPYLNSAQKCDQDDNGMLEYEGSVVCEANVVLPKFGSEPIPNAELRSSSGRVRFKVRGILRTEPAVRSGVRAVEERFERVRTREPMLLSTYYYLFFLMQRRSLLAALKN